MRAKSRPKIHALLVGLFLSAFSATVHAQSDDDLEQCIVLSNTLFNTYRECVSQVISYYAARARDPDVIITFAKQQCGVKRERYVGELTKCMGKDVAHALADDEEASNLIPHLHKLIANAAEAKLHGDPTKPSADDPLHAPMSFRIARSAAPDGRTVIIAQGAITKDTPDLFSRFVSERKIAAGKGHIRFNSPGGLVLPALALGTSIRKLQFSTEVAAETASRPRCASSCVYVFLGGTQRTAEVGQIGVHRFYQDLALTDPSRKAYDSRDLAAIQKLTATLVDYVTQMGAHPGLVSRAANTPENTISYLTAEELTRLKVVRKVPD